MCLDYGFHSNRNKTTLANIGWVRWVTRVWPTSTRPNPSKLNPEPNPRNPTQPNEWPGLTHPRPDPLDGLQSCNRQINIERLLDLFEQDIENCSSKFAKVLYLMYSNLEEGWGQLIHAMRIYERGTRAVADKDRLEMFNFYIRESATNFSLTSARPINERAIEALPDGGAKQICLTLAEMEGHPGEINRARTIYGHAWQFCDPRISLHTWTK